MTDVSPAESCQRLSGVVRGCQRLSTTSLGVGKLVLKCMGVDCEHCWVFEYFVCVCDCAISWHARTRVCVFVCVYIGVCLCEEVDG